MQKYQSQKDNPHEVSAVPTMELGWSDVRVLAVKAFYAASQTPLSDLTNLLVLTQPIAVRRSTALSSLAAP